MAKAERSKMDTVYTKIWNALKLAVKSRVGVTFTAHESLELLGWLEGYEESMALLKSDYQQMIDAGRTKLARCEAERDELREALKKIRHLDDADAYYFADCAYNIATAALEGDIDNE